MLTCKRCGASFPTAKVIAGKKRRLEGRSYCLVCSPFKAHDPGAVIERAAKNEKFRRWQRKARAARKRRLVELLGGRCCICGYNRECPAAYAFHHADPAIKGFTISGRGLIRRWQDLVEEAKKCVLLCMNCHAEVHWGLHPEIEIIWRGQVAQLVER